MTQPSRTQSPKGLSGWYAYGNYVTLLVRRRDMGTPVVKLMDLGQFIDLVREIGAVPEIWAIGDDGKTHPGRHRNAEGVIAFHFPTASQNDFAIDLPTLPPLVVQPLSRETP